MTQQESGRRPAWPNLALVVVLAGAVVVGALVLIGNDSRDQQVGVVAPLAADETTSTTGPAPPSTITAAQVVLPTTTTTTAPRIESACNHPVERKAPPPEVEVWVTLDKSVYARGERVVATVHVRNRTDAPYDFSLPHGGRNDAVNVTAADGMQLWRDDSAGPAAEVPQTLQPGEERTAVHTWEQNYCTAKGFSPAGSVPSGRYVVHGSWRSGWWAPPVELEIR